MSKKPEKQNFDIAPLANFLAIFPKICIMGIS